MSRAACLLPFSGTFTPILWQLRQRFVFSSPDSAFNNWFLFSDTCGSWHFTQSRTAGGCTVPFKSAAFLSAWQVRHKACEVVVISFTRVTSLLVRISWQLVHPMAIAECTDLPFVLSSWQAMQVAGSALGSSVTGCLAAESRPTQRRTRIREQIAFSVRLIATVELDDFRATRWSSPLAFARTSP